MDAMREQAWHDTLSRDELADAQRIGDMPPSMAIGYVYVELKREMQRTVDDAMKRGGMRWYLDHIGSGLTGGILSYLAIANPWLFEKLVGVLKHGG